MSTVRVFNRMLRTRLFLNLLPFVVILLAMSVYAIILFSRVANSVDVAVTQHYQNIYAAEVMRQALAGMDREARSAVDSRIGENKIFSEYQKQFEDNLALQRNTATSPGLNELNDQLTIHYQAFLKSIASSGVLLSPKENPGERRAESIVIRMNALLEKIREQNYQAVLDTSNRIQKSARDVTRLVIIGMVIVLAISVYTCYQLGRSILRPIQQLTRATRELGEGNPAPPVPVVSRDELGELAMSFNKMAAQLAEYRRNTSEEIIRLHRTMETTLASFPDPIFVLNREGRI